MQKKPRGYEVVYLEGPRFHECVVHRSFKGKKKKAICWCKSLSSAHKIKSALDKQEASE